jgi:large repetitive protein
MLILMAQTWAHLIATQSLQLKGAENKIFKCGTRDITNGTLYYRIYPTSGTPGSFSTLNLPSATNISGAGLGCQNQKWEQTNANINLLSGLCDGNYTIEVYTGANYQSCGTGEHLANNNGNNYKATFTVNNADRSGIFQSAVVFNINGGGNTYYDMLGNTPNFDFGGTLATFCPGQGSLVIAGGENKTFKCAVNNILNGKLYYRVYPAGNPGGTFTEINFGFVSDDGVSICGPGSGNINQTWASVSGTTNLLTGLIPGTYTIEIYTQAGYETLGLNCPGTHFANNGGANYTANFVIEDNQAPVPDVATLPTVTGECSASVTAPTATDNCSGQIVGTTNDPVSYSAQGTYTITWTYDDGNGNTSTQTQTVIVDDVTSPVPDVATLPTVSGECSASVTAPTATDNCSGQIVGTTNDPVSYSAQGTYTITWTYDDGNGNTSMQTQTVIVDDVTAPVPDVATLPTVSGECSASVTAPTATDNCEGPITGTTTDPTSYTVQGTYTITWTYDDGNGNTSTQTQTVIVDDVTAPVPDVATLPTVSGECSASVTAPTATDNCEGPITGTTTDPTSYTVQGTYTITWTYDDGNGNTSTQTQTVIVDDVTAPVPDVATLPTVSGECSASVTAPTATDNCEGPITGTTTDPTSYTVQGTYTITWTYDDGNGNTSTQTQTVIVDDVTAPVPDVATLPTVSGECSASVTAPTATDNCEGPITGTTTDPTSYTVQGTYTITWTYDDGNGNTSTQTQTVIVDDVTAPVPDVATLPTVSGECSASVTAPTATDNCEGPITGTTTDPTSYTVQGTYTITWTYDDGNGNTSTQTQTVIVDDVTAPVPDVATLPTVSGECSASVTAPTATDNCEGPITGTTTDPTSYTVQGTYTITWTYDDGNGNTSTQTQTVIVDDVTAPVPDVATLPTVTGECSASVTAPTATDNCEGPSRHHERSGEL